MSVYSISLFLHIAGACALLAVLAVEVVTLYGLRRARAVSQAREWARLLSVPRFVGGPAALAVLLTGIHLTATRWGSQGWIIAGLAGMVVIAGLGIALTGRRTGAIVRALPGEDAPISAALRQRLHDPVLSLSVLIRTALFFGVVFVMSTKPGTAGALTALGVALVLSLAALPAWRGQMRMGSPSSESQGS